MTVEPTTAGEEQQTAAAVTASRTTARTAHLSPDGRRILFTDRAVTEAGSFAMVGPVYAWDVETSERTLLFEPRAHERWGSRSPTPSTSRTRT